MNIPLTKDLWSSQVMPDICRHKGKLRKLSKLGAQVEVQQRMQTVQYSTSTSWAWKALQVHRSARCTNHIKVKSILKRVSPYSNSIQFEQMHHENISNVLIEWYYDDYSSCRPFCPNVYYCQPTLIMRLWVFERSSEKVRDYLQLTLRTLFSLKPCFSCKMSNLSHISIADCRRHTFGIAWVCYWLLALYLARTFSLQTRSFCS